MQNATYETSDLLIETDISLLHVLSAMWSVAHYMNGLWQFYYWNKLACYVVL